MIDKVVMRVGFSQGSFQPFLDCQALSGDAYDSY